MLIRHDPHLSAGRILMPVPRREWRAPSLSLPRDQLGNEVVRTRFRLRARLHDGHAVWTGWFEDRDDADAFLFALISGSLRYERNLWRLPTPEWHPGIGPDLSYEFTTTTFLTGTGASQTYNVPADWNNANNIIRCVGGGGSGGARRGDGQINATGGGGGGYGEYTNLTLTAGGTATYGIVDGGAAVSRSTNGETQGNAGGDAYFGSSTYAGSSVGGLGGDGGNANLGTRPAAPGGGGKGTASFTGGSSGAITASAAGTYRATGGGGAAGPNGNGNNGVDVGSTATASDGGSGDAGFGGAAGTGGTGTGGTGGNGTEFQTSPAYGCGGGGGGRRSTVSGTSVTAGTGGTYGAAGGGCSTFGTSTSGAGVDGLIVVEYTPFASLIFNPQPFQHILVR